VATCFTFFFKICTLTIMKLSINARLCSVLIGLAVIAEAHAQLVSKEQNENPARVEISATPQKDAKDKERSGNKIKAEKSLQYSVKILNRSFRDIAGLTAEYRIFIRNDSGKGAVTLQKMSKKAFKLEIPSILKHGEFAFDTEAVLLKSTQLDGGWVYTDGTRNRIEDRGAGIWMRVFQDGKVIGEYMNPTSLKNKESFD